MKNISIWDTLPKPFFVLAPMDAVTDTVFRRVVIKAAPPDLFFTEFTNATGWVKAGSKATGGRFKFTPTEQPLIAHLWGTVPQNMSQTSIDVCQMGFVGIDLNMGCPVKHVVKNGACSALIHNQPLAQELIEAAKTSGLPVSVKTRLGIKENEVDTWVPFLLKQNIAALTMHCRTQKEMSKVPAQWANMRRIVELRDQIAPQTKIIVNGDILDREQATQIIKKYSLDGAMIGRGVFHNIFCFETESKKHKQSELLELLNYHLDLFEQTWENPSKRFEPLKKFFKVYIRDFDGANELRARLMQCHEVTEVRKILSQI
jgi:tRNA-dihydrouridine synthase